MKVFGFDPGSHRAGYGIIEEVEGEPVYITSGVIPIKGDLPQRLVELHNVVKRLFSEFHPDVLAVEAPFVHKNAKTALRLGQVQGVVILLASIHAIPFFEYTPKEVKEVVTGYGGASKEQVREMVRRLLKVNGHMQLDASDALAVALCHLLSKGR